MYFLMTFGAAISFAVGGIFMKISEGGTRVIPSLIVYGCFLAGASLQTSATQATGLSVTYMFVLGLEAILSFSFGVFVFGEGHSHAKILGLAAVVAGIVLLHAGEA